MKTAKHCFPVTARTLEDIEH